MKRPQKLSAKQLQNIMQSSGQLLCDWIRSPMQIWSGKNQPGAKD